MLITIRRGGPFCFQQKIAAVSGCLLYNTMLSKPIPIVSYYLIALWFGIKQNPKGATSYAMGNAHRKLE